MKSQAAPERMCCVCRERKPKSMLWRIAIGPGGAAWDPGGKADGRGLYVCRDSACVKQLARRKNCQKLVGAQTLLEICGQLMRETEDHG